MNDYELQRQLRLEENRRRMGKAGPRIASQRVLPQHAGRRGSMHDAGAKGSCWTQIPMLCAADARDLHPFAANAEEMGLLQQKSILESFAPRKASAHANAAAKPVSTV